MEKNSIEKLKEIVERREERETLVGGEIFAGWGVLAIITHNLFNLLFPNVLLWVGMLVIGILAQTIYTLLAYKNGWSSFWGKMLSAFWIFLTAIFILIVYVYPFLLKLYPPKAIYPLNLLMLSIGMYVSSEIATKFSFKVGSVVFLISSFLTAYNIDLTFIVFNVAILLGLIVPGIWSFYEKRK